MKRATVLVFMLAAASMAAVPTISNIESVQSTHASVMWRYQVSTPSYVRILYGTASGVYSYATQSYSSTFESNLWAIIPVTGLTPGTTYYFRMTARPDQADDTNICNADSCGSMEQVFTTPVAPSFHPSLPTPPALYQPVHPDTTSYIIVSMKVYTDGSCVAASAVAAQPGWSGSVSVNDSLQTVLNEIGYGTVVQFPQAATCAVFETDPFWHTGVVLPNKVLDPNASGNIDSTNHRWIVLRTAGTSTDFPPFGVRTSPALAVKTAKLVAQTPGFKRPDGNSNWIGQIFNGATDGVNSPHHYWLENLELTHRTDSGIYPADVVDPMPFTDLILVKDASYLVLDRLYAHGGGFPARTAGGIWAGGNNSAVVGCYLSFDYWRMAAWPTAIPTISNYVTLAAPAQFYKRHYLDAPSGMTAPATISLTAPYGFSGSLIGYLGPGGLTVAYPIASGVSVNCSGCTATAMAAPAVPYNQFNWFTATVTSGEFTAISGVSAEYETTYTDWAPWGFTLGWGAKMLVSNNHFEGPGQTVYIEPDGIRDDVVFQRNLIFWPQDHLPNANNPLWNGLRYNVRNPMEVKRGRRWIVDGNIFDGSWSHQNTGQAFMAWGSPSYTNTDAATVGTLDWAITNNVIRNVPTVGQFGSGNGGGLGKRALISNNLAYNINRDFWNDGIGSPGIFWSGHWMLESMPEDVTMSHNTFGPARGLGPAILIAGGVNGVGEGLNVKDNLVYMDLGNGTAHGPVMLDSEINEPTHPPVPYPTGTTLPAILGSSFVRAASSVVSNYNFANNVVIGGLTSRDGPGWPAPPTWTDETWAEISAYATELTGNFLPAGNTLAAREIAAGLPNAGNNDFSLAESSPYRSGAAHSATNGGNDGVSYADMGPALGLVGNITVTAGTTAALISYTAPDGNACWVETSADGTNWTQTGDSGGNRERTTAVLNLTPSTGYQYRILCYFEQLNMWTNSNDYQSDQITQGILSTAATSQVGLVISLPVALPSGIQAVQAALEYGPTPELGSQTASQACISGCTLRTTVLKDSLLYYRRRYLDQAGNLVGVSRVGVMIVR